MFRHSTALAALALAACATTQPDTGPRQVGAVCKPDTGQEFVGRQATAEAGDALLKATGARTLRWGPPRTAMTMDFRADRLTVAYDDDMIITRVSCG